ncbi:galactoside alpha-(1,2)-fucosyltransferase 2-like [Haliotis rubra]|uniref:galactoside alpha-(1,2)-fucosyltransferase 2-like n=1 Tax=Haliotis rubra TaxID=36100 RepID=UPI001EE59145|nr:galactoside alpha-(1,2)-fucosyltransferase 2-like [Haliotis rubra]
MHRATCLCYQRLKDLDPHRTPIHNITQIIAGESRSPNVYHNVHSTLVATTPTRSQLVSTCKDPFLSEFKKSQIYLCNKVRGRLGNQMFAYASAYGVAKRHNRTVVIETSRPLNRIFSLKAELIDDFCVCDDVKNVQPRWGCRFDASFFKKSFPQRVNVRLNGYLQSWMYFRHMEDDIRRQFTFTDSYRKAAREIIEKTITAGGRKATTVIAVHIRRGDITAEPRYVRYGYKVPNDKYFFKAFAFFREKVSDPVFLLFSDNFEWTKRHLTGNDVIYMEGHNATTDMALMIECNHTIMSVGSFGWWAAYLAGGTTIYYRHPAWDGSELRKEFSKNYSDYFMPEWIGME